MKSRCRVINKCRLGEREAGLSVQPVHNLDCCLGPIIMESLHGLQAQPRVFFLPPVIYHMKSKCDQCTPPVDLVAELTRVTPQVVQLAVHEHGVAVVAVGGQAPHRVLRYSGNTASARHFYWRPWQYRSSV